MHTQTHILSGWCVGNLFSLNARQRLFCMIAGYVFDMDGISHFWGQEAFWKYHHMFHTLLVAVICCMALSLLSKQRFRDFPIYLGIFHLHMLMDLVGSGEGWGIPYFSPFYKYEYMWNRWDLYSWQNLTIFGILFFWTLAIAKYQKRTPLEAIWPKLDRHLLEFFRILPAAKK